MSIGVMRTAASSVQERAGDEGQDHALDELDGEQHDDRRQVESTRFPRRQHPTHRSQHRLRDLAEDLHDGIARVGADPRDQRRGDDHVGVEVQKPADEADELDHYWRPSSRERSVARSTALMMVRRIPPSSRAAMPAMVVPPGEATMSLSCPGCMPVSKMSLAEPSTVCVASVMAVARSSPILTPPSASASMTMAI